MRCNRHSVERFICLYPSEFRLKISISVLFDYLLFLGVSKKPIKSVLEDALETLEIVEPVVGKFY